MLDNAFHRRAVRRAVRGRCQAVEADAFTLLGERMFDLSPRGMLVACDREARVGSDVVVSFRAPGSDGPWLDAEAVVARIIEGHRPGDLGYCMGLDFTYFEKSARHELLTRLAGLPPPVPQRRVRTSVERRHEAPLQSVLVHKVVTLWDEPVFPLTRRRYVAPAGVFAAA
jgi:PilZ domain